MPTWLPATVVARQDDNPALFTLDLDLELPFVAGQFVSLTRDPGAGRHARRAYSIASPPGERLHFLFVEVEGGKVSPGLRTLRVGDVLFVADRAKGRFVADRVPRTTRTLWMFATGTGIAPFRSMLLDAEPFPNIDRIIVVYAARSSDRFIYADELASQPRVRLIRITSRETCLGALEGRCGDRLADGSLERAAGCDITASDSHVMLCGNPEMITHMQALLTERGLQPDAVTTERYW